MVVVSPVVPSMLNNISQDNFPLEEPNCICMLFAYMINQQYINIFINVHLLVYQVHKQHSLMHGHGQYTCILHFYP